MPDDKISLPVFQIGKFNGRSHGDLAFVHHLQQLRDQFSEADISSDLLTTIWRFIRKAISSSTELGPHWGPGVIHPFTFVFLHPGNLLFHCFITHLIRKGFFTWENLRPLKIGFHHEYGSLFFRHFDNFTPHCLNTKDFTCPKPSMSGVSPNEGDGFIPKIFSILAPCLVRHRPFL